MDFWGTAEEIDRLESQLDGLQGSERREALVTLGWYLRQRDSRRALQRLDEAQALMPDAADMLHARLLLARAEALNLLGDAGKAAALLPQAMVRFVALGDAEGEGDAWLEEGRQSTDRGSRQGQDEATWRAVEAYRRGNDAARLAYAESILVEMVLTRQPEADVAAWTSRLDAAAALRHPGVDGSMHATHCILHDNAGEFGHAVAHLRLSYEASLKTGRIRLAISAAVALSDFHFELGSADEAVKWADEAAALARRTGWPLPTAAALTQAASLCRRMGRIDDAARLIGEAAGLVAAAPHSRIAGPVHYERGMLDSDHACALDHLDLALAIAQELKQRHLWLQTQAARADRLSSLGRIADALACLDELMQADPSPSRRVEALRTHARISARHALAAPAGSGFANGAIHVLHEALTLARENDAAVPHELLAELSLAHEAAGQMGEALAFERQAAAARERSRAEAAAHLATALQVRHETERARLEAAQHKALAEAAAARADTESRARLAKSAFLASMSHELRSPLNSIVGFTELLLREPALAAHREALEIIRRNGGDLCALIDEVLRTSKAELGPPEDPADAPPRAQTPGRITQQLPSKEKRPRGANL